MADTAISDLDAKTNVNGEELIPIVDLRESAAADQNKYITSANLFGSIVIHENEMVFYENAIVSV